MSSQTQPDSTMTNLTNATTNLPSTTSPSHDNPPPYDTLSLSPPSLHQPQSQSQQNPTPSTSTGIRQKFAALKAEDERRKAERITHVSAEEADRITGLDRHRVEEEKKSAERKRGGRSMLGMMMLG